MVICVIVSAEMCCTVIFSGDHESKLLSLISVTHFNNWVIAELQCYWVFSRCPGPAPQVNTFLSLTNSYVFSYVMHTHTPPFTALFPGLPTWAGTRQVKPIWILLKQETVSGSGISWAIYKSAPCSRQTTTPAPHHSVFYRPDALPAAQPTASKHWRHYFHMYFHMWCL